MSDTNQHALRVEAWMQAAGQGLAADQLLQLFESALAALWQRAHKTLGEVTLLAIVDRVLHGAVGRAPLLATLEVDASGFHCDGLRRRADGPAALAQAMQLFLGEFLAVVGSLTAEILTPALHAALSDVTAPPDQRASRAARGTSPVKATLDEGRSQ